MVKWLGFVWGFYIDGVSYFISAVLLLMISSKKRYGEERPLEAVIGARDVLEPVARKNIWKEIREGISYLARPGIMREVAAALFAIMGGIGFVFCVLIVFVQDVMSGSTEELGVLGAFAGAGLFAGAMLYGRFCQSFPKVKSMLAGFAIAGAFLSLFVLNERAYGYLAARWTFLFLMGFSFAPVVTCANYLVHMSVPDEARGRVFSGIEAVMHLGFIFFLIISAVAARFFSTFSILFYSGITFVAVGTAGAWIVPRERSGM
jgi:predicted MFS family arabinose efflux permease